MPPRDNLSAPIAVNLHFWTGSTKSGSSSRLYEQPRMPEYVRQAGSRRLKKFSYRAVSANKHDNGKDTHNRTASLITVALQQISSIIGHCGFFGGFENVMQVSQEDRDAFSGSPFCQFTQTKVGVSSKRFTLEAVAKSCHEKEKQKWQQK